VVELAVTGGVRDIASHLIDVCRVPAPARPPGNNTAAVRDSVSHSERAGPRVTAPGHPPGGTLPDLLGPGTRLLFVDINPGLMPRPACRRPC
jgi:hypothetical protein